MIIERRGEFSLPEITFDSNNVRDDLSKFLGGKKTELKLDKIAYSMKHRSYCIVLTSDRLLSARQINSFRNNLFKEIPEMAQFVFIIKQPKDELLSDMALFEKTVKETVISRERSLIPFIKDAAVELKGNDLYITFNRSLGPSFAEVFNLKDILEEHFREVFDLDIRVREYRVDESLSAGDPLDIDVEQEQSPKPKQDRPVVKEKKEAPKPAAPAPAQEKKIFTVTQKRGSRKSKNDFSGEVSKLASLSEEGEVMVEGTVLSTESRLTKNEERYIFKFGLTDNSSSIYCIMFIPKTDDYEEPVKKDDCIKVKGTYRYDTFSREFIISVKGIQFQEKPPMRMDTSEEKRVELHLHTFMSAQDGLADIRDYVKRASKWGHKAIAVTDHGVVQAFPAAATAGKDEKVKILFGVEAYVVDTSRKVYEGRDHDFSEEFVVFDIETTGFSKDLNEIIDIGAVKVKDGNVLDRFQSFVRPRNPIPERITQLTGITDAMVADAPEVETVIRDFFEFAGNDVLIAHNADFDTGFVFKQAERLGIEHDNDVLDNLMLARAHIPDMRSRSLDKLAKRYKVPLKHHRAVNDSEATAMVFYGMLNEIKEKGYTRFSELNYITDTEALVKSAPRANHFIILCRNKEGLVNLYRLISVSHLKYFKGRPRLPKSELIKYRNGLIYGSACEQGELYQAVLNEKSEEELLKLASFYDYLEIQPDGNNEFLVREGMVRDHEHLHEINRKIIELGRKLDIPVVATGDVHFLDPEDEYFRRIVMETSGFRDADQQAPLYFKTTDEMLSEFSYLGEETAREVVIKNPNAIADSIEEIELFPGETAMPHIDNADDEIREAALKYVHKLYGDPMPKHIEERLFKELNNIINNGFGVLYWAAMKLVTKSMSDGYLVGSRGYVGSSFAAFAMGITEVNPLKPHYRCPNCTHSDFDIPAEYACGPDMPEAVCPVCGTKYIADGYDIPFEVFLGLNAEKVPDIDLNFSGEYKDRANAYVEELFGSEYVFRAGTISAIKDNIAKGLVRKFFEQEGKSASGAEIERLAAGISGVKKTTGQHPGGLVIVPRGHEIYEYTPIQKPADKEQVDTITTHFDFNSMHDILIKLDILGHDNPTIMRILQDMTGLDPLSINVADEKVLSLFLNTDALGVRPDELNGVELGVLGIPEFGTHNTMKVLKKTKPRTVAELVRISGLTHGTDVWDGNAETLIENGTVNLSSAICTRDDIMLTLVKYGVPHQMAFFIMESVRKGKWAKKKEKKQDEMEQAMRDANVPEWFIWSCEKIQYMFPKAHAVAYVLMALRIAYFKIYYPKEFYAATFTIRSASFDARTVLGGAAAIEAEIANIDKKGREATKTEKDTAICLEIALEMVRRGIKILPPDLKKSRAARFTVEGDYVRMPFTALPSLGEKAAELLEEKAKVMDFSSIEELRKECKLSQTVIDTMRDIGCLDGLPEKAQLSLFEGFGF